MQSTCMACAQMHVDDDYDIELGLFEVTGDCVRNGEVRYVARSCALPLFRFDCLFCSRTSMPISSRTSMPICSSKDVH